MRFIERRLRWRNCLVVVMTGVRILSGSELARSAFESGYLAPGTDLAQPCFYFSPEIDEARVLTRINQAITLNTNIVHSSEEGDSLLKRSVERVLRTLGIAPPFWRFTPHVLRTPPMPYFRAHYPPLVGPAA